MPWATQLQPDGCLLFPQLHHFHHLKAFARRMTTVLATHQFSPIDSTIAVGVALLDFARYSCIVLVVLAANVGTTVRSDTNIDSEALQIP